MAGQRSRTRLRAATSIVAGFLSLFVLTLALAPRAEAYIYWTHAAGYIERANLDGSPSVAPRAFGDDTLLTTAQYPGTSEALPVGVEVDGTHIYWAHNGLGAGTTIGRANIDGTELERSFITGALAPLDVAVDAAHVYWSNDDWSQSPDADAIGRANLDGTQTDQAFIPATGWPGSGQTSPGGVAVDARHIYWSNYGAFGTTLGRANLDGSDVDPRFITGARGPQGVAVDGAHIYWTNAEGGTIGRANLDGTGVDQGFIGGATFPQGVAVEGGYIYWTNEDANTGDDVQTTAIGRARLDGTEVDHSFIPVADAQGVAVDALRSFSFGKVKRNKKRGTARLVVEVAGPGEVELAETNRVKPKRKHADAAGKVKLPIKPRREAKRRLKQKGKAKVKAEVTYTPRSAGPNVVANANATTLKLVRRS